MNPHFCDQQNEMSQKFCCQLAKLLNDSNRFEKNLFYFAYAFLTL